jgi:hypothetical protein
MSEEYRRHAAECLRLAECITDSKERLLLIDMAQAWQRLAREKTMLAARTTPVLGKAGWCEDHRSARFVRGEPLFKLGPATCDGGAVAALMPPPQEPSLVGALTFPMSAWPPSFT